MIRGAEPERKPWSRKYINAQVQRLRHMFKWSAGRELVPVSVHESLRTVEPLRRGRTEARETDKVLPVPQATIDAVPPHLSSPHRALVQLQVFTGARPGELLAMRPCDIEFDNAAGLWLYRPEQHKNAFRERERVIFLGPQAQRLAEADAEYFQLADAAQVAAASTVEPLPRRRRRIQLSQTKTDHRLRQIEVAESELDRAGLK